MSQWNPNDYRNHSSQQQKWARENLAKLGLEGHERILDIGCGDGKITAELARCVPRGMVLGLDSSAEMIAFARKRFPPEENPKLRFEQGDAQSLGFIEQFDRVISFACLHWVIDHRPVLSGIHLALRPGGRALMQFGGKGNAAEMVRIVSRIISSKPWADYFADFVFPWGFYSPEEYRPWVEEAGLIPIRLELVPKDMSHEGPKGLEGWLRTTWMPYWQRVPEPLQQTFLDQVIEAYLADHPLDSQGLVHLSMVRLEVEAARPLTNIHAG
jgi:trans-aconitate 2-methyltransferase